MAGYGLIMGRADQLRSMFSPVGKGLEIGPSHNPLMPKAAGFDVEVLDYLAPIIRESWRLAM
jgi:hypothetical protein